MMRSSSRPRLRALALALASTLATAGIVAVSTNSALAAGDTFYVDNRSGSDCSDDGAGTSPDAPWCSFAPAAGHTLGPGESLLLARDATWSEKLTIGMQGSADNPATIGAYGTGDAPRLLDNDADVALELVDIDHAVIADLDIGEEKPTGELGLAYGIMATSTTIGHEDVTFRDLSIHDTWQIGLLVRSTAVQSVSETALTGLTFSDIQTTGNAQGIAITAQGSFTDASETFAPDTDSSRVFRDVLVDGYHSVDDDAGQELDRVSAFGVPCVALTLQFATGVVVRNSVLDGAAACRTAVGTTALFLGVVDDVLLANNVIINTPNTANPDMVGIDYEARTHNVTLAGNYFADNYGGALEYLAIHGQNDYSLGHLTTGNVFINNGRTHLVPNPGGGAISQLGNGPTVEAEITDNISAEPFAFLSAHAGGSLAGFTSSNNIPVDTAEDISASLVDFGGDAWGYAAGNGDSLTALSYDAASATYTGGGVSIARTTLTPSAESDAVLTWTAPDDGVVSVRGYALPEDGSAEVSLVGANGASLAGDTLDADGAVVTADDVSVAAGDVLRFVVDSGSGAVGWAPTVAYTSRVVSDDAAGQWTFSVAGDTQGWTSDTSASIARGAATLTTTDAAVTLDSPDGLDLDPAGTAVRLRYQNDSTATSGRIFFTTATDQDFDEARSVSFSVNSRSDDGIREGYQDVVVPLSGVDGWTGSVDQIRIVLNGKPGTFAVDSVALITPAIDSFEFDDADGWTVNGDVRCENTGTPSTGATVDVNNAEGSFATHADLNWNFSRMQQFRVSTPRLAQIDAWVYKTGDPQGCLFFRVVEITNDELHTGSVLFSAAISPTEITEDGGFVSIYPGLDDLDTDAVYGLQIFNPYSVPGTGTYGVAYTDDPEMPAASFGALYSPDNRGTWYGPETNRSLRFRTLTAAEVSAPNIQAGYTPVTVVDGVVQGDGGYEPALRSPAGLELDTADTRYVHIRMSNPEGRSTAYLMFTTEEDPTYDLPGNGWPVPNEAGYKGIAFSLEPGEKLHEYVLDMSTIPGWTGTVTQLMLQPATRWSYRIGDLSQIWTGKIDYVRFSPDGLGTPPEPVVTPDTTRPETTLVSPTSAGPLSRLDIRVDATDDRGLAKIVANVYRDGTLVKSTQTAVADGARSATHTASVTLPSGTYTVRYNAHDTSGNVSATRTVEVTVDATPPTVTVKSGASFTVGDDTGYDLVSVKLYDAGKIDRVTVNGVVKNLSDNVWSDVNGLKPGVFGAVRGENTLVAYDVAGNATTFTFTLR